MENCCQALFRADELASAAGGVWAGGRSCSGEAALTTDTRTDNHGKVFLALRGGQFDGHRFLDAAVSSGCIAVCVNADFALPAGFPIPALKVADTLRAYQDLALFHRLRFPELVVWGVTGSVGKTSVKEMLAAIAVAASAPDEVLFTIGNTNNQVGVPQNLLKLNRRHRYAVLEAGTSSPGEIAPLARIIAPEGALVNTVAPCHLEKLGTLENVAAEKGEIFRALRGRSIAVVPGDCPGQEQLKAAAAGKNIVYFASDTAAVSVRDFQGGLDSSSFKLVFPEQTVMVTWGLSGSHQARNAAGAASLAYAFGIPPEVIAAGLNSVVLPGMRMRKAVFNGVDYYNDAYNANPASMAASIRMLKAYSCGKKIFLVLGGMLELGAGSREEHCRLIRLAETELPGAVVLTVGKEYDGISRNNFETSEMAGAALQKLLQGEGELVFVKGSRGYHLERALPEDIR